MTLVKFVLEQLEALGVRVVVNGDKLRASPTAAVTPAVRELIAANRPALLAALQPLDLQDLRADLHTVICAKCKNFSVRLGSRPDGWCRHYQTEAWRNVPFWCAGFEADKTPGTPAYPD